MLVVPGTASVRMWHEMQSDTRVTHQECFDEALISRRLDRQWSGLHDVGLHQLSTSTQLKSWQSANCPCCHYPLNGAVPGGGDSQPFTTAAPSCCLLAGYMLRTLLQHLNKRKRCTE